MPVIGQKSYRVVYADPPWLEVSVEQREKGRARGRGPGSDRPSYKLMSYSE